jgi:formate-dependent nitrite reductase membrane component NrfD
MSDTFFMAVPHWRWLIIGYFFIGGIASGCYFIAALLELFGTPRDRPVVRLGYYVALVGIMISGILLSQGLRSMFEPL